MVRVEQWGGCSLGKSQFSPSAPQEARNGGIFPAAEQRNQVLVWGLADGEGPWRRDTGGGNGGEEAAGGRSGWGWCSALGCGDRQVQRNPDPGRGERQNTAQIYIHAVSGRDAVHPAGLCPRSFGWGTLRNRMVHLCHWHGAGRALGRSWHSPVRLKLHVGAPPASPGVGAVMGAPERRASARGMSPSWSEGRGAGRKLCDLAPQWAKLLIVYHTTTVKKCFWSQGARRSTTHKKCSGTSSQRVDCWSAFPPT